MNKQQFRRLVKRLHPDCSGTNRTLSALRTVLARGVAKVFNRCEVCDQPIRGRRFCALHYRAHRYAPRPALPFALSLFLAFSLQPSAFGPLPPSLPATVHQTASGITQGSGAAALLQTASRPQPTAIIPATQTFRLTWDEWCEGIAAGKTIILEHSSSSSSTWSRVATLPATATDCNLTVPRTPQGTFRIGYQ